jgi:hypothetical protein
MDAANQPYLWGNVRAASTINPSPPTHNGTIHVVDACVLFARVCSGLLTSVGCPATDHHIIACVGSHIADFVGTCSCGPGMPANAISVAASARALTYVIDGVLAESVALRYAYVLPARSPGSLLVGSSNFKQFLSPEHPLPGFTTSFG